jgi:uncharacterized protein YegL
MNNKLTELVMVIDRSGSMGVGAFHLDMEGGINQLIKDQKGEDGDCNLTLIQFDNEYDVICSGESIDKVGDYHLVPRGSTALCDAVGRGIAEVGERLAEMKEENRPGAVVFIIVTDGAENDSHEYTKDQIAEKIKHQEEKYNWQFVFLGAEIDAFEEAGGIGVKKVSTTSFAKNKADIAYSMTSQKLSVMRSDVNEYGKLARISYSDEEREELNS